MKTRNLFIFSALVALASCNEKHDRNNKGGNNWVEKVVNKEADLYSIKNSMEILMKFRFPRR
jgi:hypothetical protein